MAPGKQIYLDYIDLMRQTETLHPYWIAAVHIEGGQDMVLGVAAVEGEGGGRAGLVHGRRRRRG